MALGFNRRLHAFIDPWLGAIYATPTIALLPIIVIVFGIGMESKVIVVWLEAFVVIAVSTLTGTGSIEDRYLNIAYSFGAPRSLTFRTVAWPSVFPFMLTGARIGVGRALVGVVVAELLASNAGIGYYITLAGSTLNITGVMLGVVLIGTFGVISGEALRRLERRFERWRPAVD
jgi:NitT/TauT family transport system permease protein